jgi:hypothetical protein
VKNVFVQLCSLPTEIVESDYVEAKGWCKDEKQLSEKISEAAACLANASGGLVVVGVEEDAALDSRFSPCPHYAITANWLVARVQDLTFPPVECTAHDVGEMLSDILGRDGVGAFVLWVPKTKHISGHITVKGISKKRVGKDCKPNYSAEDDRTKSIVPDVSLADLNTRSIEWAISQHHRKFGTCNRRSNN